MNDRQIILAEVVRLPSKRLDLNNKLPWAVEYYSALNKEGRKVSYGISFFKLRREAKDFCFSICPTVTEDIF